MIGGIAAMKTDDSSIKELEALCFSVIQRSK